MKKEYKSLLVITFALVAFAVFFGSFLVKPTKADSGSPNQFPVAINGSSTCGQFSVGTITIGPSATATSTQTGNYTIVFNGTTVTSTSQNTSTAATTVATAIATALTAQSSTLGIAAVATSNVVNVTSTVWGAFTNITASTPQRGLTIALSTTTPATQITPANGVRAYLDISDASTGTYVGFGPSETVGIGHWLATNGDFAVTGSNMFTGAPYCIGATSNTNAVVEYITH